MLPVVLSAETDNYAEFATFYGRLLRAAARQTAFSVAQDIIRTFIGERNAMAL